MMRGGRRIWAAFVAWLTMMIVPASAQVNDAPLYELQRDTAPRWFSFENQSGAKGQGGRENDGAKGHAFDSLAAGKSVTLAAMQGPGILRRMWLTFDDRSPEMLRALRLAIYWDGAAKPAVSAPLGDFFGHGLGRMVPLENALVTSPEGRSFVSFIPMPFRRSARVVLTNTAAKDLTALFYDVDFTTAPALSPDTLYFHASWHRVPATKVGEPFEILPRIEGRGRFLGTSVGVVANPAYGDSWFGEGEVKMYLDGDREAATLVGSGTEDYIATAYGQGAFVGRYSGSPIADTKAGRYSFYRFHIPDPIFFYHDIRVVLPQIGGAPRRQFLAMQKAGAPVQAITLDSGGRAKFRKLLETPPARPLADPSTPDGWVNYYRSDDVSAVAYYYLDRP